MTTRTDPARVLPTHLRTAAPDGPRAMGYWDAHAQRKAHEQAGDAEQAQAWQDMLDRWHFLPLAR